MRARYGEYHTSLDNKELIGFDSLRESLIVLSKIADAFEENKIWRSTVQSGEPHLSKRNLYPTETMAKTYREGYGQHSELGAIKWLLNLSDGTNDLLHIAERSRISFSDLVIAAQQLYKVGLLEEVD